MVNLVKIELNTCALRPIFLLSGLYSQKPTNMKTKQELYAARPVSPHLSIYRFQISSVLSAFHRITGILLFGALTIIAWGFILFTMINLDMSFLLQEPYHFIVKYILYIVSYMFFYHLSTGIRHLIWDSGKCLSKEALHVTGWIAIASGIILTLLFWTVIV